MLFFVTVNKSSLGEINKSDIGQELCQIRNSDILTQREVLLPTYEFLKNEDFFKEIK